MPRSIPSYDQRDLLVVDDIGMWVVGMVFAFASAFTCVRWLIRYVSTHTFIPFAWYRIAFGIVVLVTGLDRHGRLEQLNDVCGVDQSVRRRSRTAKPRSGAS